MHSRVFAHQGRGLSGNYQHGNKGKDRPARIPIALSPSNYIFALTSVSQ